MTVENVNSFFDEWAPKSIAWEKDNVGLQVGSLSSRVKGIVVALDATEQVVEEARMKKANLLVTHHPLLFNPVRTVTDRNATGRCIAALVRGGISLYSAHTNLDFTRGGTSFALAEILGLRDVDFLSHSYRIGRKVVTFVPSLNVEKVATAMARAGAGRIGNYKECSFQTEGTGIFRGNEESRPAVGKKHARETVKETRLEMVAPVWKVDNVIKAMKESHPYEEVAYDVYPLENTSSDFGMGAIGNLEKPLTMQAFIRRVKRNLHIPAVRSSSIPRKNVRRIAVCGGSGSALTQDAVRAGADVFVTADVKYHSFHDADQRIAVVDAGHYETEIPVMRVVVERLRTWLREHDSGIPVHLARTITNPVTYV
ncbi:MAG: Nif3-like dinuclear metal center hexameric protein [Bacteroidota bacterium]